jgi:phenylacetate-CoA ligase
VLEIALAQLRFAASLLFGTPFSLRSLEQIVSTLKETRQEFGPLASPNDDLYGGPHLDEETRQAVHLRRFRSLARKAAQETVYYRDLFASLDLDLRRLSFEEIARVPLLHKDTLRANPDAFVCRTAVPCLRALTTGTTGKPTSIAFSSYEMRVYFALEAIGNLFSGELAPDDIVQISTSARGALGNVCLAGACAHIGAMAYLAGVVEPAQALALLTERHHIAGKKERTSILYTYPSYLGELVGCGLRMGYRPTDFGLERIYVGGEVVTQGLKRRCQQLFGDARCLEGGYGMTEIWPFGGRFCEDEHLHFEVSQGMLEVLHLETGLPCQPGEIGTIVATPFPPYRQTTLLLRYDTQDVAQVPAQPPTCSLRHLPATGPILGKRSLSLRHDGGWTFPRSIREALEGLEEVPLPARYSARAVPGGVALDVVTRAESSLVFHKIENSLHEHRVPVQQLRLMKDSQHLSHAFPLRCDLREHTFPISPTDGIVMQEMDRSVSQVVER